MGLGTLLSALEWFDVGMPPMVGSAVAEPLEVPAQSVSNNFARPCRSRHQLRSERTHALCLDAANTDDFLIEGTVMSTYSISSDGNLAIAASRTSSLHDFDFLLGEWTIRNRKLNEPLARCDEWTEFDASQHCHQILQGFGDYDIFSAEFDGTPFEGFTLRLFDPQTRLWTLYWADSRAAKLDGGKVGSFDGDIGEFFAREVFAGKDVIVRFHWDKRDPKAPVWSAAFSGDEGHTWEWNWYAHFERR